MPEDTLYLIGQTLLAMRGDIRELSTRVANVEERLGSVETKLDENFHQFREELTVTSAMVMRYSSAHIAWGAMERQIQALNERLARVESRIPAE